MSRRTGILFSYLLITMLFLISIPINRARKQLDVREDSDEGEPYNGGGAVFNHEGTYDEPEEERKEDDEEEDNDQHGEDEEGDDQHGEDEEEDEAQDELEMTTEEDDQDKGDEEDESNEMVEEYDEDLEDVAGEEEDEGENASEHDTDQYAANQECDCETEVDEARQSVQMELKQERHALAISKQDLANLNRQLLEIYTRRDKLATHVQHLKRQNLNLNEFISALKDEVEVYDERLKMC